MGPRTILGLIPEIVRHRSCWNSHKPLTWFGRTMLRVHDDIREVDGECVNRDLEPVGENGVVAMPFWCTCGRFFFRYATIVDYKVIKIAVDRF